MSPAARGEAVRRVLRSSFHGRGREFRGIAGWSLVQALPAFLSGRLLAEAIDDGFLAGSTGVGFAWLGALAAAILVGAWGTRQTYLRLAAVVEPFRDELTRMAVTGGLRRSIVPGASADTGAVARLTGQIEIVRDSYASVLLVVQSFVVTTVGALLGLLTLAPLVLVLVLPPLVVGLALFAAALGGMAERQRTSILADEGVAETANLLAGGLRDVAAGGGEEAIAAKVGTHIDAQANATRELARFTALRTIAVGIGGWLPIVLILAAGPWLVRNGVTTGALLGALTYVSQGVQAALETLVRTLGSTGLWLIVTLRRIVESADMLEGATKSRDVSGSSRASNSSLRLKGVTFGYGRSPEPVIDGLDLVLERDDHLAVVGPSGVGKSTVASLIAGLLEPQAGEIEIGGISVGELDAVSAADHRVLIPQEAYVFAGTLRENLTYLNREATDPEIDQAVDLLGLRLLVERVGGLEAELIAAELSAGERQLITLVRAYLSPAPLVLLDEASSHLDPAAEARVEREFARRPGALIVIAHRISSALRARKILVMDGRQALLGTHEDLLARSPLYRDLVGYWQAGAAPAADAGHAEGLATGEGTVTVTETEPATKRLLARLFSRAWRS